MHPLLRLFSAINHNHGAKNIVQTKEMLSIWAVCGSCAPLPFGDVYYKKSRSFVLFDALHFHHFMA